MRGCCLKASCTFNHSTTYEDSGERAATGCRRFFFLRRSVERFGLRRDERVHHAGAVGVAVEGAVPVG